MTQVTIGKAEIIESLKAQKENLEKLKTEMKDIVCKNIDRHGQKDDYRWFGLEMRNCEEGVGVLMRAIDCTYDHIANLTKFSRVESIQIDFEEFEEMTRIEDFSEFPVWCNPNIANN